MSKRKRRRKRRPPVKRDPIEVIADEPEEERTEETSERYRPDPISEKLVPREAVAARRFRAAGTVCNKCGWRTRKSGLSGRQAMRAHSKVHANDLRAYRDPVKRQSLILGIMVLGLAAAHFLRIEYGLEIATRGGPITLAAAITAISLLIGVALYSVTSSAASTFSRTAIRSARWLNIISTLIAATAGAVWVLGSPRPEWYGLVMPIILMGLAIFAAGEIGYAARGARTGKWRSPRYTGLVRPRDEDAEDEYSEWRSGVINAIRHGRVKLPQLRGAERSVIVSWLRSQERSEDKRRGPVSRRPRR